MKKKIFGFILLTAALIIGCAYLLIGNPIIAYHNYELKKSILAVSSEATTLNEVVPFEWDCVYTFSPYASKAEMEQAIGFQSRHLRETVSENMVQLIFVNDGAVTASVCGYESVLGYRVSFPDSVTYNEEAVFAVHRDNVSNATILRKIS